MTVALVTAAALPGLFPDDRLLLRALVRRGVRAEPVIWEDALYDWAAADMVVIRSAWDYSWRRDAFLAWADGIAPDRLWNPAPVVHANTHKRYLLDLAGRGVSTIPTVLLPSGAPADLAAIMRERGWARAVIKAAVGQSGRYARRVDTTDLAAGQARLAHLLTREDMLVQPFVPSVRERGELSLVFIDGRFTHAVRKRAAAGEFRVHDDFGGTAVRETPAADEIALAEAGLATLGQPLLYARVDLVSGADARPAIMELELVEPELFLSQAPEAADRLAEAITARR